MISFTDHYNDISFDRVSSETKYGKDSRHFNNFFSRLKKRLRIFFKKENFKSVIKPAIENLQGAKCVKLSANIRWELEGKNIQNHSTTEGRTYARKDKTRRPIKWSLRVR